MFREQYKAVFNRFSADRTQIDKILNIAEKSTDKNPKIVPFRYAGTLVAAVVIVVAATMFPNFSDFFGTEQKEFEPLGVVNYETDKTFTSTELTSGQVKADDVAVASEAPVSKNRSVEKASEPAVAMMVAKESEAVLKETENAPFMMKSARISDEDSVMVNETIYDMVNGSVTVTAYSNNSEIENALSEKETDLLVLSETTAYVKKDGLFYKLEAFGLTEEELKQFINENL